MRIAGKLLAFGCCALAGVAALAAQQQVRDAVGHPQRWPVAHSVGLVDPATEAQITQLMAGMSLEEKVGQMIQADIGAIKPEDLRRYPLGSILAGGNSYPLGGSLKSPASDWIATARAFRAVSLEARPGHTPIPIMFGVDTVHGNAKVVGGTVFPHNVGLGAMRDPALMERIGLVTAQETAAAGIDWAFGPTLAVPQDVRWGRAFEGYSQDPKIVASYAGMMVRGLQGEPGVGHVLQAGHVAASAKHFLGDGGTTNGVDQGNAEVSEHDLVAIHAAGYPPAIDAGVFTVMVSYSSWNGQKMHGNRSLITDVLKGRMGFEGFVVSDWNGHSQIPGCTPGNCAAAVLTGIDMIMAPDAWKPLFDNIVAQVQGGQIPMSRIDDATRRILRVKFKLGLFDTARPLEGHTELLGSAEHRAVARQAVRESLVLLKNNGGILPLKSGAHILVAGEAADDIGWQSGGWTLGWQGTGNTNADFPHGQSIYAGIAGALRAGGGSAELAPSGAYTTRPDAAIVVFGEKPYAEFQGDRRTLDYQPDTRTDLAVLKKLRAQGIPVVAVFLSGRPMWVNPEINASNAFVAAWLPGSEGGGIADVLIGDAAGKPRYDFSGKLSFSWPKTAAAKPEKLFAVGYGLTYASKVSVPKLGEVSKSNAADSNYDKYFVTGHTPTPWKFDLRDASGAAAAPTLLSIAAVDADGRQEGGRQITWSGGSAATLAIGGGSIDLVRQANGDILLAIQLRLDAAPTAPVVLGLGTGQGANKGSGGALDLTAYLKSAPIGEWRLLKVKLSAFGAAGADLAQVTEPLQITTSGALKLTLLSAQLESDTAGVVVLPPVAK